MKISDFDGIFEKLAKMKYYFVNAQNYIGIVSFLLSIATFKKVYNLQFSIWLLAPIAVFFAILIGYLDYEYIMKYQLAHQNKKNNMQKQLDRIENLLTEVKKCRKLR